jgi:uncharacterized protein involved in exopolysaccharide biosynthesis
MEDIVAMMRQDLTITPEKTWTGRTASFRVSFQGPDAAVVTRVTNKIASLYVEENLKTREIQAEGTSEFIETQLKEAKHSLDELEATVSQYKVKHNGELPQQENSLNGILGRLGAQLEANRDAINRAQQQKVMLQNAVSTAEGLEATQLQRLQTIPTASTTLPTSLVVPIRARKKSEELQAQAAELRQRYSDDYPDLKRLRILIDQAKQEEEQRAQMAEELSPVSRGAVVRASEPAVQKTDSMLYSPELIQTRERIASMKSQLDVTNQELETRQREQQRIIADISLYQSRVNSLPIREQEMAGLTRDYEISKANYRSLLDKKIAAEMATDMERREKSERFTVVDPARVPEKPFKPKRVLLSLGGSLFGLALGLVLGLAKEIQEAKLLGEWELPTGVNVLGRLPHMP